MKIAIIGSHGYNVIYGGYETFVTNLVNEFTKLNTNLEIIIYNRIIPEIDSEKINSNINVIVKPTINSKSFSQLYHSFFSTFDAINKSVDIILYVNLGNAYLGVFTKLFKIRTVINVDGVEWKRPKWKGLGSKFFYINAKIVKYLHDYIICDSKEMQLIYKAKFKTNTIFIPYGVNIYNKQSEFKYTPNSYFLLVGRIIPDNNFDYIIKKFLELKTEKKIFIVGESKLKDSYYNKVFGYKSEKIKYLGLVKNDLELFELYRNAFCYIHGHEFGGTNPTLLTALVSGVPILALNTKFNAEVLDSGKYGMLFNKNEFQNILQAILLNNSLISTYRNTGIEYVLKNYSWYEVAIKYLKLIEN